jgi:hypothetical protein
VGSQNGPAKHIEASCSETLHFEGMIMHILIGLKESSAEMYLLFWSKDPLTTSMRRKSLKNVWDSPFSDYFASAAPTDRVGETEQIAKG